MIASIEGRPYSFTSECREPIKEGLIELICFCDAWFEQRPLRSHSSANVLRVSQYSRSFVESICSTRSFRSCARALRDDLRHGFGASTSAHRRRRRRSARCGRSPYCAVPPERRKPARRSTCCARRPTASSATPVSPCAVSVCATSPSTTSSRRSSLSTSGFSSRTRDDVELGARLDANLRAHLLAVDRELHERSVRHVGMTRTERLEPLVEIERRHRASRSCARRPGSPSTANRIPRLG